MRWRVIVFLLGIFFLNPKIVLAENELGSKSNNKFGIHLAVASEEDLQDAATLVNSSGGDWGYLTLVIEEKDRSPDKWQHVFDQMRALHLIPIVRLATSMENGGWRRPHSDEAEEWAKFLDSLNWVVKNRYIVLFNEPNHASEWGGAVDAQNYGQVASEFAKALKEKNPDFFIMLAGFDAASPQRPPNYEDEEVFLRKVLISSSKEKGDLFAYLDGWASHSYPNHGFIGSPWGEGRNSIKTYLWELNLLTRLGIKKTLPVFITETGWPHAEGKTHQGGFYSQNQVTENFRLALPRLIEDSKVVAVTPFILNYQGEPFDHFSWRKLGETRDFYPQYKAVSVLPKLKGDPEQEQKMKIINALPKKLITGSTYQIPVIVRNEGQAIWSREDDYQLKLVSLSGQTFEHLFSDFYQLKPFEEETLWQYLKTGDNLGSLNLSLVVTKDGQPVSNEHFWTLEVIPAIDVDFKISLFPKIKTGGDDFKLLIYNGKEEVIFEKEKIGVVDGIGKVEEVKNLTIEGTYRIVILKPYYLPRQGSLVVKEKDNKVVFERMLPLDLNLDGKFSAGDFWALVKNPKLFQLFWPD